MTKENDYIGRINTHTHTHTHVSTITQPTETLLKNEQINANGDISTYSE